MTQGWFMKLTIFLVFSSFFSAHAADGTFAGIHHHYQSPRALGMGDAFSAVANDYSAIFYNPAALAWRQDGQINMSMDVAITSSFMDFYNQVNNVMSDSSSTPEASYTSAAALLTSNYGNVYGGRAGLFEGFWVRPNWGVAVIPADLTLNLAVHNQGPPALDIRSYLDTTVAYSYADEIKGMPGRLAWGTTVKFVNRGFVNKQVNALDIAAAGSSSVISSEDFRDGYTIDGDLGLIFNPMIPSEGFFSMLSLAKPTFSFVGHNLLDMGFGQSFHLINRNDVEAPERLYRTFDIGSKWEYPSLWIFGGRGTMDIRDIGHPYFTLRKALHIGFEFDWTMTSWWKGQYRVGLNQGFLTVGMSALFSVFRLDLAYYGEDVGSYNEPKESRNLLMKFNIDI